MTAPLPLPAAMAPVPRSDDAPPRPSAPDESTFPAMLRDAMEPEGARDATPSPHTPATDAPAPEADDDAPHVPDEGVTGSPQPAAAVATAAEHQARAAARSIPITSAHTTAAAETERSTTTPRSDLASLDPTFRTRLERVIERMRAEFGYTVDVVETIRTQARQDALFRQGRELPGPVVTWTRASLHTQGRAADVMIDGGYDNAEAFARLAVIAREEGLRTLGPMDRGHVELPRSATPKGEFVPSATWASARANPATPAAPGVATVAQVAQVAQVARVAVPGAPATSTSATSRTARTANASGARGNGGHIAHAAARAMTGLTEESTTAGEKPASAMAMGASHAKGEDGPLPGAAMPHAAGDGDAPATLERPPVDAVAEASSDANAWNTDPTTGTASTSPGSARGEPHRSAIAPGRTTVTDAGLMDVSAAERGHGVAGTTMDAAERVARMLDLRESAAERPLSSVLLRLERPDGSAERIRVDARGATVGALFETGDAALAEDLGRHLPELARSLERQGLDPEAIAVRTTRQSAAWAPGSAAELDRARAMLPSGDTSGGRERRHEDGAPHHHPRDGSPRQRPRHHSKGDR